MGGARMRGGSGTPRPSFHRDLSLLARRKSVIAGPLELDGAAVDPVTKVITKGGAAIGIEIDNAEAEAVLAKRSVRSPHRLVRPQTGETAHVLVSPSENRVTSRNSSLNPGAGGTTPMLAAAGSVMTAAISSPRWANTSLTASWSL